VIAPVLLILAGWLLTLAVAYNFGTLLIPSATREFRPIEILLFRFVAGFALLSQIVLLLGLAGFVSLWMVFVVSVVSILAAVPRWRIPGVSIWPQGVPEWLGVLIVAIFGALYFVSAMQPETSPDGSMYHLGLVAKYVRDHRIVGLTDNFYSSLPAGIEMLYLFAFLIGKHSTAALIHLTFLWLTAGLMVAYASRVGRRREGIAAALLVFVAPVVAKVATSAYNEAALICAAFGMFFALRKYRETPSARLLCIAGICAGFAYNVKPTAFVAIVLGVLLILFAKTVTWRAGAVFLSIALAMVLPWLIKNLIFVGNPFAPFLSALFPSCAIHPSFEKEFIQNMRSFNGFKSYWQIPLEVTVRGGVLQGLVGPVFLLAPLALLSLRDKEGRACLLAAAVFAAPYANNIGTRFLIPVLPFLALALMFALAPMARFLPWAVVVVHAFLSWPANVPAYAAPNVWWYEFPSIAAALRIIPEDNYLQSHLPGHQVVTRINRELPRNARLYSFGGIAWAYLERDVMGYFEGALNERLREDIWTPKRDYLLPRWLSTFRFPAIATSSVRLSFPSVNPIAAVGVNEVTFFHKGSEIVRSSSWTVNANPNACDCTLAFDNNPVTRWRNWEPVKGYAILTIDFHHPVQLDEVRVVHGDHLEVSGATVQDEFKVTSRHEIFLDSALNRAAAASFKEAGVTHLVIAASDAGNAVPKIDDPSAWRLKPVIEEDGVTVFELR